MEDSDVVLYLAAFGYEATSAEAWESAPCESANKPELAIRVKGHYELDGHTMYGLSCRLLSEALSLDLKFHRSYRLKQLREDLHDEVKRKLGRTYGQLFAPTPFAKRGGFTGTTDRLRKWFGTWTAVVNGGKVPPALVAKLLFFLQAPYLSGNRNTIPDAEEYRAQGYMASNSSVPDQGHEPKEMPIKGTYQRHAANTLSSLQDPAIEDTVEATVLASTDMPSSRVRTTTSQASLAHAGTVDPGIVYPRLNGAEAMSPAYMVDPRFSQAAANEPGSEAGSEAIECAEGEAGADIDRSEAGVESEATFDDHQADTFEPYRSPVKLTAL